MNGKITTNRNTNEINTSQITILQNPDTATEYRYSQPLARRRHCPGQLTAINTD